MKRNRLKKCSHNLLLIGIDPPVGEWRKQTMKRTYEKEAAQFCEYIRTLASKPDNLDNLQSTQASKKSVSAVSNIFASSPALTPQKWPQASSMTALQSCLMIAASAQRQTP